MAQQFPNLSHIDLNQLLALQAILEERHVTRAAVRASLSQPAMSRVLSRLRVALGDDLLVRSGIGYKRTPRGDRLLQELEVLLPRLNAAIRGRAGEDTVGEFGKRLSRADDLRSKAMRLYDPKPCITK
ncbi:LysR family transcriptional regulator [Nostoc mirabile]|uniref:LysR family transcriptional regulator n=1 Tax=Nostoc mirabile TaxID=2907820 RepID=UPI0027DEC9AD|nr:LysR family transcriptional regulator [Nostoc mirabile]